MVGSVCKDIKKCVMHLSGVSSPLIQVNVNVNILYTHMYFTKTECTQTDGAYTYVGWQKCTCTYMHIYIVACLLTSMFTPRQSSIL